MRVFVTGGTGFLGRRLVAKLRERGDEAVALVRRPADELDAELVQGDLSERARLAEQMRGCDAVFHVAAIYKVGIPASERPAMFETNVRGTENVLDAAVEAGVRRIVHVSTVGAFGNTHGRVVDENSGRIDPAYVTYYDETKHLAHAAAQERIARGAPVVITQPGAIYGPGDHSELGSQLEQASRGRLRFLAFGDLGVNAVHVDDVADGLLLAHDRGGLGESYVLGGEITRLRDMIATMSRLAGRRSPRRELPSGLLKLFIPLGPLIGRLTHTSPNLRELIASGDGVTYWATDEKARRELGYSPRGLEEGLRTLI